MSTCKEWLAATGCALALSTTVLAGLPVAEAQDNVLYLAGTHFNPVPAGQVDLSTVSAAVGNLGLAQRIPYEASLFPLIGKEALDLSVATGVAATMAEIAATPAGVRIVIVDVSQGGIVASDVERLLVAAGSARDVLFVRIGDPTGPTGIMGRNPGIKLPGLTFVTAPNDSPYDRIIIAHQYEALSDWPAQQLNVLADLNALLGAVQYHNPWSYNVDLSTLPDSAITVTTNAAGGTTTIYRIPATGLLPILGPLKAAGVDDATLGRLQKVLKPIIDAAYTPQATAPVAALGRRLFVASVNGMTGMANGAGVTLRQTQRYLDTAIDQWKALSRPAAKSALPESTVASPATTTGAPDVASAAAPITATTRASTDPAGQATAALQNSTRAAADTAEQDSGNKVTPRQKKAHRGLSAVRGALASRGRSASQSGPAASEHGATDSSASGTHTSTASGTQTSTASTGSTGHTRAASHPDSGSGPNSAGAEHDH